VGGGATRCCRPAGAVQVFGGDLGNQGDTAHHPNSDLINRSMAWCTMANVAWPPRAVSSARRR
jgi:hypothetical protein